MLKKTVYITQAAIIAAMYAALTYLMAPISYGQLQIRVSEALTILPFFTPAAIPGLFVGCFAANILGPNGLPDIIAGSFATLIAAVMSRHIRKKWLVPLPPVLVNAVVIGLMLNYITKAPLLMTMLYIFAGQTISCYGLGYPLLLLLNRHRDKIFGKFTGK
ncbi:MAG: QueT transporter family protein [Eubacteriales bacterium]|nr:QueT transporter family protein [Eubacteriales bacterium]